MTKVISFFPLIVLTLIMVGCDREITVNLRQSGTLTGYVLDENNVGVKDATFCIESYGDLITEEMITDESGAVSKVKLLQGQYECSTSIKKGNAVYRDSRTVQVITEENIRVELKPFENVGNLHVSVSNYYDDEVGVAGLNLALINYYGNYYELNDYVDNAISIKKLDSSGKVSFENVPMGYYYVIVYNDSKEWYDINSGIRVEKKQDNNHRVNIYYYEYPY